MTEVKNNQKKKIMSFLRNNPVTLMVIVSLIIHTGQRLSYKLLTILMPMIPNIAATDVFQTSAVYLLFVGTWAVALLVLWLIPDNRPMLKALGKGVRGNTLKMFAVGLGIGLGMNLLCALIAIANGDIALTFHSFRPVSLLLVFVAVLIQSSAEEMLCRVFLYQRLLRFSCKPIAAAVINASFFTILHMMNPGITPTSIVHLFLSGIVYSVLVIYLDSPWAAMASHTAWNFCQNILLGLPNSGMKMPYSVFKLDAAAATDSFAYSISFGLEGSVSSLFILGITIALIVWWSTRHKIVPTNIWDTEA